MAEEKPTTKNIGEVSELYTLVYILAYGRVDVVNPEMTATTGKIDFAEVSRESEEDGRTVITKYAIDPLSGYVTVTQGTNPPFVVGMGRLQSLSNRLRVKLKTRAKKTDDDGPLTVDHPLILEALDLLKTSRINAKSSDKSDFRARVCQSLTAYVRELGFSIKSYIGSNPSLVNPDKANSALRFRIEKNGVQLTNADVQEIWGRLPDKDKREAMVNALYADGCRFAFDGCARDALEFTLRMIDASFAGCLAEMVLAKITQPRGRKEIKPIVQDLTRDANAYRAPTIHGLADTEDERETVLTHKVQDFLMAFASGATVASKWDGNISAGGGLLVVQNDGRIVCLEICTTQDLAKYLFESTYFDTPSKKRHGNLDLLTGEPSDPAFYGVQLQVRMK